MSSDNMAERAKRFSQLNVLIDSMVDMAFHGRSLRKLMIDAEQDKYPDDEGTEEFLLFAKELSTKYAGEKFLENLAANLSPGTPKEILQVCMARHTKPRHGQVEINRTVKEVIEDLQNYAPYAEVRRVFAVGAEVIDVRVFTEQP
jgi:hypothetical protein